MGGLIESSTNLRPAIWRLVDGAGQNSCQPAATMNFKVNGESTPGGEGFAIPINRALDIANQIRSRAPSPATHIGPWRCSAWASVRTDRRRSGLPVRSVLIGGPADAAGLRPGDTITTIDRIPMNCKRAGDCSTSATRQRHRSIWIDRPELRRTPR